MPSFDQHRSHKEGTDCTTPVAAQLCFNQGCACPPLWKASVEAIMEFDQSLSPHHDLLHNLPTGLNQAYSTIIAPPFWEQYNYFPSHLFRHTPMLPNGLH